MRRALIQLVQSVGFASTLGIMGAQAHAETTPNPGNKVYNACKAFFDPQFHKISEPIETGHCVGVVQGLLSVRSAIGICMPN